MKNILGILICPYPFCVERSDFQWPTTAFLCLGSFLWAPVPILCRAPEAAFTDASQKPPLQVCYPQLCSTLFSEFPLRGIRPLGWSYTILSIYSPFSPIHFPASASWDKLLNHLHSNPWLRVGLYGNGNQDQSQPPNILVHQCLLFYFIQISISLSSVYFPWLRVPTVHDD